MKTSTCIAKRIKKEVDTVFGVTGGNIINVVDSFTKEGLRIVSMHHEQSAAIAADAYARFKGFGVCYATSGPGVTNLITGVGCSYFDSIPVLAIGGQVPSRFLDGMDRQAGFQEVDGVWLFRPITKVSKRYGQLIDLEICIQIAKKGRKGPAFIEIPDDVQREEIVNSTWRREVLKSEICPVIDTLRFKKPILIIGAGAMDMELNIKMPFLCTWATKDRLYNHKFCKGDFGTTGSPHGNQLLKEADCIIMLGTRMDTHQVPDWNSFAPQAYKIAVGLEFPHKADEFFNTELNFPLSFESNDWCQWTKNNTTGTPIYRWIDELSNKADNADIIIPDMGQTGCIVFQRWRIRIGQRLFNGMNHSPMGYSLPGSIGAAIATGRRVIVIIGDGSLMMNLQELQTISSLKLPINIFVVNNGGYGMIRQTQADWKDFLVQGVGCDFNIPSVKKIANAFGLEYTDKLSHKPSIFEVKFKDTRICPKWKYGEKL